MKKYIPYTSVFLILTAFIAGRISGPDESKDISKKYEQERNILFEAIGQKDALIVKLNEKSEGIRRQMSIDSLKYSAQLHAKQITIIHYKTLYENINLRNATVLELDSLRASILPKSLYPDR